MIRARFEFKLQDLWIGAFWKRGECRWIEPEDWEASEGLAPMSVCERVDVWICLIPCLPLHVFVTWGDRKLTEDTP